MTDRRPTAARTTPGNHANGKRIGSHGPDNDGDQSARAGALPADEGRADDLESELEIANREADDGRTDEEKTKSDGADGKMCHDSNDV